MGKSVYSIVLSDEVIEAVDEMAYRMNTSRSNLINQILAERVSYITPEMRIREIFSMMEGMLDSRFLSLPQASESVMAVKKPLRFKYKPTVKYSVELFRSFSGCVGRLKVTLRTQSEELTELMNGFFIFWSGMEKKYLGKFFKGEFPCQVAPKCYSRDFFAINERALSDNDIAQAISDYIRIFDKAVTAYFESIDDREKAQEICEQIYRGYLKQGVAII